MRWIDLKVWATCVLALSACSDDGVPLVAGDTEGSSAGVTASASGGDDPSGGTSAVTTADPSESSSDSDTSTRLVVNILQAAEASGAEVIADSNA